MKRLNISKAISIKWLTRELQTAGVNVLGVGRDESGAYAEIAETDETLALSVIQAHDLAQIQAYEAEIEEAPHGGRAWYDSHPNAKLLFSLSIPDLETEINSLVDASFPTLPAATRTRWKIFLMAIAVAIRILVKRERLNV